MRSARIGGWIGLALVAAVASFAQEGGPVPAGSVPGALWNRALTRVTWPSRDGHAALVFRDRMWILGGATGGAEQANDVWSSADGVEWTRETAAAPWPKRHNHAGVVFHDRIWILGGWGGRDLNDVWSSHDGRHWKQVVAQAPWSGRNGHSAVVHAGRIWVLGGWSHFIGGTGINDLWSSGR